MALGSHHSLHTIFESKGGKVYSVQSGIGLPYQPRVAPSCTPTATPTSCWRCQTVRAAARPAVRLLLTVYGRSMRHNCTLFKSPSFDLNIVCSEWRLPSAMPAWPLHAQRTTLSIQVSGCACRP